MKDKIKISVIIPCFNEEKTIEEVLFNVKKSLNEINWLSEIIVIDDFSTDNSRAILKNISEKN